MHANWRAADALMKLVFPEYRQNAKVEVNSSASAGSFPVLTPIGVVGDEVLRDYAAVR